MHELSFNSKFLNIFAKHKFTTFFNFRPVDGKKRLVSV